jgi:hypothetical protein
LEGVLTRCNCLHFEHCQFNLSGFSEFVEHSSKLSGKSVVQQRLRTATSQWGDPCIVALICPKNTRPQTIDNLAMVCPRCAQETASARDYVLGRWRTPRSRPGPCTSFWRRHRPYGFAGRPRPADRWVAGHCGPDRRCAASAPARRSRRRSGPALRCRRSWQSRRRRDAGAVAWRTARPGGRDFAPWIGLRYANFATATPKSAESEPTMKFHMTKVLVECDVPDYRARNPASRNQS